ncbi:divalent cation tolerance protein CutA [Streptomyces sp. NPDC012769]|uniref:divalent cation tolerance protein CutA n=1 Tax=Streptomyces sp. NPDC012769 TaxID=3364848 RepID=UPI0036CAD6C7
MPLLCRKALSLPVHRALRSRERQRRFAAEVATYSTGLALALGFNDGPPTGSRVPPVWLSAEVRLIQGEVRNLGLTSIALWLRGWGQGIPFQEEQPHGDCDRDRADDCRRRGEGEGRGTGGAVVARLAACAHIDSAFTAVYRWKDSIETAPEWRISHKTTADRLPELAAWVTAKHSYEVPE